MELTGKAKAIYKVTDTHVYGFFDKHRYLSSFHLHSIEYEDIVYPSNENAYHAAKTFDESLRLSIAAMTPTRAKSAGRSLSLREDWLDELPTQVINELKHGDLEIITQVRDKVMYDLNVIKFSNPYLKNLLLQTGDKYLEETNWWRDDYWGVYHGPMSAQGLNKLGRILMKIRDEARQKQKEAA